MTDLPAVYQHANPRARVAHTCAECDGTIEIGHRYHEHSGLWDGRWQRYRLCSVCNDVFEMANAWSDFPDEGPWFTGLFEWLMDDIYATLERLRDEDTECRRHCLQQVRRIRNDRRRRRQSRAVALPA
ncbi:MAG: hypothetical protein P1V51_19840 [Deltaproteobacteria bacterium]|nr:hypothetical protein [Deltaproteobacteria bacterium]